MFQKIIHSGNPLMKHIRATAIFLWRLSLLITVLWGFAYLGYKSALLLVVGLPWLIWSIMNKRNGRQINHNTARSLLYHPLTWLILLCSLIAMTLLVFNVDSWIAAAPAFLAIYVGFIVVTKTKFLNAGCFACFKETPFMKLKACPECSLKFAGGGWTGFKKHWEIHHRDIESYDNVWRNMCAAHKKKVMHAD